MKTLLGILFTLVSLLSFGQGTITWNANGPSPTDYSNVGTRMGSQEYKPRDNPFQHGYDSYIGNKGFLYYPFLEYPASTTHKINIDDASKYLPKSYLDSVIYHYNKANYNALLHSDISDTITNNKLTLPYIKTLRRVYGDIKSAKVLKNDINIF